MTVIFNTVDGGTDRYVGVEDIQFFPNFIVLVFYEIGKADVVIQRAGITKIMVEDK
jgi:hypothetical protein